MGSPCARHLSFLWMSFKWGWGRGEEPLYACFVDILPKLLRIKLPSQSLGYLLLQIRNTRCTYFAYLFLNC